MKIVVTGSIALRLPDVVPGKVHRAFPAGAHAPDQPELSRRHDGQAARRLRAEHRVHAGAARRAAAADGDGRRGLRRLPAVARRRRRRHVARPADRRASSRRRSSAAPTSTTTRSRRSTPARWPMPASCRSATSGTAAWRSSRRTIRARWCSTPTSAARSASATSSTRASSVARMSGDELKEGAVGAADRHLQRLRVRAPEAEDRPRRSGDPGSERGADRHARRAWLVRHHEAGRRGRCGRDAQADRRSDGRRRCLSRRVC